MPSLRFAPLCCCFAIAVACSPSPVRGEIIENFSIVTGGDYTASNQVWGGALARGNVSGGATIGTMLDPPVDFIGATTLGVGGEVSGRPFAMEAGSVRLTGGTNGVTFNLNGDGTVTPNDPTVLPLADSAVSELTAASSYFDGVPANSNVVINGTDITFNPTFDANDVAVFEIEAAVLMMQNAAYSLSLAGAPPGATYLINVVGNVAMLGGGSNFPAGFTDVSDQILWNFADQTSDLTITSEWQGSILVANPDVTLTNNSPINGGVYLGGDFIQNAEVRSTGYTGFLPTTAVPEPSSLALVSLLGLGYLGRRRRRRG